jgi:hypothetical protein
MFRSKMVCVQVLVVPWIEDNPEAIACYLDSPAIFWTCFFDNDHPFSKIKKVVVDGAHRRFVCIKIDILRMMCKFLQPTISIGEMVLFTITTTYCTCLPCDVQYIYNVHMPCG